MQQHNHKAVPNESGCSAASPPICPRVPRASFAADRFIAKYTTILHCSMRMHLANGPLDLYPHNSQGNQDKLRAFVRGMEPLESQYISVGVPATLYVAHASNVILLIEEIPNRTPTHLPRERSQSVVVVYCGAADPAKPGIIGPSS